MGGADAPIVQGSAMGSRTAAPPFGFVLTILLAAVAACALGVTTWSEQSRGVMTRLPTGLRTDTLATTMTAGSLYYDSYLFKQLLPLGRMKTLAPPVIAYQKVAGGDAALEHGTTVPQIKRGF